MDLVRLPIGKQASVDVDCIRIEEQSDGRWKLTATALCVDADEADSASIVDSPAFATAAEAEAAGLAWAENVGVATLHVSLGTLTQPLETLEIDKPL